MTNNFLKFILKGASLCSFFKGKVFFSRFLAHLDVRTNNVPDLPFLVARPPERVLKHYLWLRVLSDDSIHLCVFVALFADQPKRHQLGNARGCGEGHRSCAEKECCGPTPGMDIRLQYRR